MPANDSNAVVLANTHAALSSAEQRVFDRAERTIARGLRFFLEVGMALKEIRDRRLYRQHYSTFEEYCARRWDFSRPRAYELVAASDVVADLSAIADTEVLPENEAQARPLTRLKDAAARRRAWHTAVAMAAAEQRPVTARDTEEAVRRLNGNGRAEPAAAEGGPVYMCIQGTNADLIATVARLYLNKGDRVADITYGQGAFWQQLSLPEHLFYRSDKITCPGSPHDFRRLPYADGSFDVVVFDPPYAHHGDTMRLEPCYNNSVTTAKLRHREIMDLYRLGMAEAKRVLKPGGTLWVKCADEVESCRQRRSHVEVFQVAQDLDLEDDRGGAGKVMSLKFIITADLHQNIAKWRDLVRVVEQEKPRFVLVAGDLLPKDGGFNGQRNFFPALADYLGAMRGSGGTTILTFFGNDDFHPLEPLLDDLAAKGLCVNLNGVAGLALPWGSRRIKAW